MTQTPYAQQYPGYPPQPQQSYPPQAYPPAAPAPYPPAQGYPQQGYPQPGFGQAPQQPQQPAAPLATGTLDDFYAQPSSGGGPSISWSTPTGPKPEGTAYAGVVARDVTSADIQQQTDPKTGQPKFFRDGRPQYVMKVPLKVQPSPEFPDGEATLFVRGQMKDELVRAMAEANAGASPKAGDQLVVQLVQRKPSRGGGNPMNVFAIRYQAGQGGAAAAAPSAPAPQAPVAPAAPPVAEQHYQQPAQQPQFQQVGAPQVPQAPAIQQPAQPQFQAPQAPAPAAPAAAPGAPGLAVPPDFSPDQQALFAQLAGAQGQQIQPQG